MERSLTVNRRRPGIVDTYAPKVYGVAGYRLKAAANFDSPFNTIFTSTNVGFVGQGVDQRVLESQPINGKVRMVWNPADYGLNDSAHIWVQLFHVSGAGVETQVSAATLILPDLTQFLHRGTGHVLIRGTAPSAVAGSALQLDLPRLMTDWRVFNESVTKQVWISFEPNGPEYVLKVNDTAPQFTSWKANAASIWIRGDGGTAPLSIHATYANPL